MGHAEPPQFGHFEWKRTTDKTPRETQRASDKAAQPQRASPLGRPKIPRRSCRWWIHQWENQQLALSISRVCCKHLSVESAVKKFVKTQYLRICIGSNALFSFLQSGLPTTKPILVNFPKANCLVDWSKTQRNGNTTIINYQNYGEIININHHQTWQWTVPHLWFIFPARNLHLKGFQLPRLIAGDYLSWSIINSQQQTHFIYTG